MPSPLQAGMEMAAAFHETRRYAAYCGASSEFNKWEGITYDEVTGNLYTSITSISRGMEDNRKDTVPNVAYDVGELS